MYGKADRGRRVVGIEVEIVGHADGCGVAGRHRTADADAGGAGMVEEARHEVAGLAGDADRTLRRVRGDDLEAHVDRRAHDALPVRPGQEDPEFVGERDQVGLRRDAGLACLAVARGGEERRLHALGGARPQQVGVGRGGGAHEDEVDLAVGQRLDVGDGVDPEHVLTLEVRAEDLAAVAVGEQVVQRDEAELPRVGGCPGDEHAARLEQRSELLVGRARPQRRLSRFRIADLDETVHGDQVARRLDDERVDVDAADVGAFGGELAQAGQQLRRVACD